MEIKQKQAYKYFAPKLKGFPNQKGYSSSNFKDEENTNYLFINYKNEIEKHLNYKNFSSEELIGEVYIYGYGVYTRRRSSIHMNINDSYYYYKRYYILYITQY